jgi:trehalose 6-phosphate synthase/phosphatase
MRRLIVVSNRLPATVDKRKGDISYRRSVGGVATGLQPILEERESIWVGWPDIAASRVDAAERAQITEHLSTEYSGYPVFLTDADVRGFYHGFSNRTIWPLFHYFTRFAEFDSAMWSAYERVNRKYRDAVLEVAEPGDVIWVNDYQLMLLPQLLREALPDASIGFFLHIPFPALEVFSALPWRREILSGLLGADLVGFHTYDYAANFLSAVRHLVGHETQSGRIDVQGRQCLADAFPMGIDFDGYAGLAEEPRTLREAEGILAHNASRKLVLSIDRLDYTKGIPERLQAFGAFLERHPEWHERVSMLAVAVPSRTRVEQYRILKAEVDELVGSINGQFATVDWQPIRYLYRSLPKHSLVAAYVASDVALVTPLRDGMNLIAKEYLAARTDDTGVMVLSEMAGAARELGEAIIVNPFDQDGLVEALHRALAMPEDEQRLHNAPMRARLARYTVTRWARDFLETLERVKLEQLGSMEYQLDETQRARIIDAYEKAEHRLLVLDYDGTITPFASRPPLATPTPALCDLLARLAADERNDVVVVAGREYSTLQQWLGDLPIGLVAEHGAWVRERGEDWHLLEPLDSEWKERLRPVLEMFADRTPGAFLEEKTHSLVWHYRTVEPALAAARLLELREALSAQLSSLGLFVVEANRSIEVKPPNVSKGRAARHFMRDGVPAFVLAVGDDRTDEDLFEAVPDPAWTIKVGSGPTKAHLSVDSYEDVLELLELLAAASDG